ncbi:Synaptotagmin-like protein 2 [Myotis davidii]|uniref:Synaptotagmin-like protein 2 n=1 Tax=Myotis davidii TaxID=225400 RepID=L5MC04_MYODS|nr:Synaptotagmin-like protein 2 [Myotis davidii]
MIDLSFLTEEEQETIMKVLQRDAALKRVEDERVRHLPEKVKDDQQLKNMSGQWFYEAKAKRHRDKIHGTDIIRASMRKKRLQVAAEQNKDRENRAKESWVNNVNKDAFLPPELAGVVEEPEEDVGPASPSPSVADPASTMIDTSQENSRNSAASSAKQRKNPFNSSKLPEDHLSQQTKNEQSRNGRTGFFQTSKEGELSESKEKSSILDISSQKLEKPKQTFPGPESGSHIKPPIPKARKMINKSHDLKQDDNQSFPGQRTDSLKARGPPRGILKRNSSSSSTDSDTVRFHQGFEPKSKIGSPGLTIHERISEKEHSLEDESSSSAQEPLKQVRFSAVKEELPPSPGLIQGREVGEFSVLESNRLKNGTEDARDQDEFWKDPTPSQYREPLPLPRSASSPSALKHETHQPKTSGPFPSNGQPSPSEVLPARPQSSENSPTISEHKAKSSELSRLESELYKSPADERSHVEPEPSQVPDRSSRDHQQGSEEEPSPVLKTLERSAARKMPSKSLEDISSDSSNQAKIDNLPEELVRSADDVSTVPSQPDNLFSHPDKLKRMSKSVPAFLQDEASLSFSDDRETDTASESSYHFSRHKKSPSSLTNLSSSSGMTSLSSVSGSVMSVYSGDFGNLEVKGSIQFAVDYVDSLKELHIFVAQCKDLAAADIRKQRSDPYVKTYLLPDKGKMGKKKTLVVKKTLNPVYNEILRYKIEKQILKTQKLNLSVWHRDTFKRNSFLGEVELDLETWDWDNKQNKQLKWYPLKRKTAPVALEAENRGKMKLALQYVPEPIPGWSPNCPLLQAWYPTTALPCQPSCGDIWVKECLDLPMLRGSHLNSFVKCIILPDTSRKSRQRTRAVGKTTNPVFNHTMVYDGFRPEDLTEACVELTVWDHYKLTNQFLGGLRIGFGTGNI